MPEHGLSQMDCIKAAVTMAEFCVLASSDKDISYSDFDQMLGCFVVAAELSCREDQLKAVIESDLRIAGLDKSSAADCAEMLTEIGYLERVSAREFIHTNEPSFGLRKGRVTDINEAKFVKKIKKLGNR